MKPDGNGRDTATAELLPVGTTALLQPADGVDPLAFVGDWHRTRPTLLGVTVDRSIQLFLAEWRASADATPEDAAFVGVGETTRSAASRPGGDQSGGTVVRTVADPTDFGAVETHVRALLDRWRDRVEPTVVVVDSVTGLLDVVPDDEVRRFVTALADLVADAGAVGFLVGREPVHARPDDSTLVDLQSVCDGGIEAHPAGWRLVGPGTRREVLPTDETFSLLSDGRRRNVLRFLDDRDRATVETLADWLAADSAERRQLTTSLAHVHLPKLADAGVVDFDARTGVVTATPAAEWLLSVFDLPHEDRE